MITLLSFDENKKIIIKKIFLIILLTLFFASNAYSQKVVLRLTEWAGYVSFLKNDFREYAKKHNIDVEIEVLKPDITDDNQLYNLIRFSLLSEKPIDVCTPSSSFYLSREKRLLKLLYPLDISYVPNYLKIPESFRESNLFKNDKNQIYGIVFLAGPYGLAYNANKVKTPPDSWNILWSDQAKGKYSVNNDTAFVNAYISIWADSPGNPTQAYDINYINKRMLQKRLNKLAAGTKHLWSGFGNTPEQLADLHYTATWGFGISQANKAGLNWKLASPKEGVPLWVDAISLTKKAAKNPIKVKAFYLFANFLTSKDIQLKLMKTLGAFPLNIDVKDTLSQSQIEQYHVGDKKYFDERFFWHPLDDRTSNAYNRMWNNAKNKIAK